MTAKELARSLWSQGLAVKVIVKRAGLSRATVYRICADLPRPFKPRQGAARVARLIYHREDFDEDFDRA